MPQLFCINALASPSPQTLNLTFPAFPLDTKKDAANERLFNQNGGEIGIRTLGTPIGVQLISSQPHSTTLPSLR